MTDTSADIEQWERFALIVNGPALFNAAVAGSEVGIFRRLSAQPGQTAEELGSSLGLAPHPLRVLLFSLCAAGLLARRDGLYTNTRVGEEAFGDADAPGSWHDILLGWQQVYYPSFARLTEAVRSGRNVALDGYPGHEPTLYERLGHQPDLERVFHRSMSAFTVQSLPGLVESSELEEVTHLVDVGGGAGTTAAALLARYPSLRVTIVDLPSVSGLASRTDDVGGRLQTAPADLMHSALPTGADAVLFSHFLEVFEAADIVSLMGKAFEALPSGGRVFVYGFNADEDETRGVYSARLSLYLNALATGTGMTYPASDYEGWLHEVGFVGAHTVENLPFEHGLTVARKP